MSDKTIARNERLGKLIGVGTGPDAQPDCALCGEPFMNHSSTGQCLVEVTGIRNAHYEPSEVRDVG